MDQLPPTFSTLNPDKVSDQEIETPEPTFDDRHEALGISREDATAYLVDGYRYTHLRDAVAQAHRSRGKGS